MRRIMTSTAAACAAVLCGFGPAGAADGGSVLPAQYAGGDAAGSMLTYHGFRIDLGNAQGNVDVKSAVRSVEHQIDIVDRAGLSPGMMATFRSVPIRINVTFMQNGGGSHYSGGSEVTLSSLSLDEKRPVLLHEYMHVLEYHDFPGGFQNPEVRAFYDEAQSRGLYPAESYMMSNPVEFFAMATSCYLNGSVAREPFTRDEIRQRQPDLYAYMARLFGPRGRHASVPAEMSPL